MLLALSRGERWIGIDLFRLQCAEGTPRRAVSPPDQLVSGADAENRHGGGPDRVQEPAQFGAVECRPVCTVAADDQRRRLDLLNERGGHRVEALHQAWLPCRNREAILRRLDSGAMSRTQFGVFENQIVLGVDVDDSHWRLEFPCPGPVL